MTIIASLVIVVDQVLRAYAPEISKQLSVFVADHHQLHRARPGRGLRHEAPVWPSFLDGIGQASATA